MGQGCRILHEKTVVLGDEFEMFPDTAYSEKVEADGRQAEDARYASETIEQEKIKQRWLKMKANIPAYGCGRLLGPNGVYW